MVHGKNRIPYRIDQRLSGLADLNMMPLSRSGCSLSLKTHNMGNPSIIDLMIPFDSSDLVSWAGNRGAQDQFVDDQDLYTIVITT